MTSLEIIDTLVKNGITLEGGCPGSRKDGPFHFEISSAHLIYNRQGYVIFTKNKHNTKNETCIVLTPQDAIDGADGKPVDGIL